MRHAAIAVMLMLSPLGCAPEDAGSAIGSTAQPGEPAMSHEEVQTEGRRFLDALLSEDAARLAPYESDNNAFLINGRLHPELHSFLYGQDGGEYLSVREIAQTGPISIMLDGQHGDNFAVLFYVQHNRDRMRDPEFLRENFMVEYFACEFTKVRGRWKIHNTFCFSETDGPYPNNDPDI